MKTTTFLAKCAVLVFAIVLPSIAAAQQTTRTIPEVAASRGETVVTRARPELDPLGIRAGSFLIYPQLGVQQSYTDNVFATRKDTKDDFITDVLPELSVESDWANHALNFSTGADLGFYSEYTRQGYEDWFVKGDGRLDITRNSALFVGGGFAREHEEPGDPDAAADAKTPTEYDLADGFLRHIQKFGRFRGIAEATVLRLDYDKVNTVQGNETSTTDRDRTVYAGGYQLGYELVPQYEVFVRAEGNRRQYDERTEVNNTQTFSRNSDGFTAVAGLSLDLGGVIFGDIYAGYMAQYFSSEFKSVSGPAAGGTMTWNVTTLTTLNAQVNRVIQDTTQAGSPAIERTTGGFSADHELLRNLILTAALTVTNDDYAQVNRDDYYYIAGFKARYLMNRNLYGTLGYQFLRHTTDGSDTNDQSFNENLVWIGLETQL